ncbi:hypothetical protein G5714_013207 [Onychostoma macrolepis]|uniref:Uncharacterized protein n=1 Tax=Onychostoma macrolepis TaxID=369639 RepID=A0A7J6CG20_9TELE|nr:hypothetical protein G5714_013207 [Onychostoma macrolepis]
MPSSSGVEVSGETGLHILRTILSEQLSPAAMLNISVSQEWRDKYLQEIDQFVENHFPTLPAERPQESKLKQIQDFLKRTRSMIYDEVLRLTPALKDAGLLDHLKDSYSRHIFTNLDLLLNRDLSVKEVFYLLLWAKDLFFSPDPKLTLYDPLLLTGWFEKAKQKLLQLLKEDISTYLQNILHYEEEHGHNGDSMDEETFIRVHLDATQCLDSAISEAKIVGLTLKHAAKLESHFEKRNRHINILMEAIQRHCASLPETASEIKTVIVKIAYDSVSKVYLECLMKTKFRKLEKCWGNAEEKITEDVQHFHETFSELNGIAAQENQLLQRMTEVVHCSDVEALKITCCYLFRDFPQESKRYVPGLLRWKGVLLKQQVREVLDMIRELGLFPNDTHVSCLRVS